MKTKNLLIVLFILGSVNIHAQTPNWIWAKNIYGNGYTEERNMAIDGDGNLYMTGYFNDDSIWFGSTLLRNTGPNDLFIVKYDGGGNPLWARSAQSSGIDIGIVPSSITADAFGNIYVAGYFSDTVAFNTDTLISSSNYDIFIAKYDSSGNLHWAKQAGGNSYDQAYSVTTDVSGNIYMTGSFSGDSIRFGSTTLVNASTGDDVFIVKCDSAGHVIWATSPHGATNNDVGRSVCVDAGGNVYVTGSYSSATIQFGSTTLTNTSAGNDDFFIAKYDSSGNALWAKGSALCTTHDVGTAAITDNSGNVYVTGEFSDIYIRFGSTTITAGGFFLVKYSSAGNVVWAKGVSMGGGFGEDIAEDKSGNIFITGSYQNNITFGSTTLNTSGGIEELFVVKYNSSGTVLWAKSAGGDGNDMSTGLCVDRYGNAYVGGSAFFDSTMTFGSIVLLCSKYSDIFIARIGNVGVGFDEPVTNNSSLIIYPNPFHNITTISIKDYPKSVGVKILSIFDILGREVLSGNLTGNSTEIVRGDLQSGVYLLRIRDGDREYAKKMIIE